MQINLTKFKRKPKLSEFLNLQENFVLNSSPVKDLNHLSKSLESGKSVKLNSNPEKLNFLILEFNQSKKSLIQVLHILKIKKLEPNLAYETFNSGKDTFRFRLIYQINELVSNIEIAKIYQFLYETTKELIHPHFFKNPNAIVLGTNKKVFISKNLNFSNLKEFSKKSKPYILKNLAEN
ncbi:hypothetical protein [Mycoplasmopsis synoviae]|uniref:Uncharacterized protein n=1 Tax=Mycoplasmopsis synoviae TaxID=2109 RepID=A0AAX3EZY0_MYCSY|nr:hypothetical protein [Mycoplasmopsis synoviae]UZW64359.1 hypothetical protein OIE46_03245 [Mycoplasmopsis synoviae]